VWSGAIRLCALTKSNSDWQILRAKKAYAHIVYDLPVTKKLRSETIVHVTPLSRVKILPSLRVLVAIRLQSVVAMDSGEFPRMMSGETFWSIVSTTVRTHWASSAPEVLSQVSKAVIGARGGGDVGRACKDTERSDGYLKS
jgi:hypothetical protein